jgi:hypothetical protein
MKVFDRLRYCGLVTVFGVGLGLGCGTSKVALTASPTVPAAQGEVRLKQGDNGNHVLKVKVRHLADPEKIGAREYVVWASPPETSQPQNLGALRVDKDLDGTLETVTPWQRFDLFITAEPTATAAQPTGQRVLWASVGS